MKGLKRPKERYQCPGGIHDRGMDDLSGEKEGAGQAAEDEGHRLEIRPGTFHQVEGPHGPVASTVAERELKEMPNLFC